MQHLTDWTNLSPYNEWQYYHKTGILTSQLPNAPTSPAAPVLLSLAPVANEPSVRFPRGNQLLEKPALLSQRPSSDSQSAEALNGDAGCEEK